MKYILFVTLLIFLFLLRANAQLRGDEEFAFIQLANIDPKINNYGSTVIEQTIQDPKYQTRLKECSKPLMKYFSLKHYHSIVDYPSEVVYSNYLGYMSNSEYGYDITPYKDELIPHKEYKQHDYIQADYYDEEYKKHGIQLRNEFLGNYESLFDEYRTSRLEGKHKEDALSAIEGSSAFNSLKEYLQTQWGSKLGPKENYNETVESLFEVQLMVYIEKEMAQSYKEAIESAGLSLPSCQLMFLNTLKEKVAEDTKAANKEKELESVVGTWNWSWEKPSDKSPQEHGTVTFYEDHHMDWDGGTTGSWTQKGIVVTLTWKGQNNKDDMTLMSDKKTLTGYNTARWYVVGKRQ